MVLAVSVRFGAVIFLKIFSLEICDTFSNAVSSAGLHNPLCRRMLEFHPEMEFLDIN
jgi:hypothetical protein